MDHSNFKIIELPKETWKGVTIPLVTRSDSFYDFIMDPLDGSGCTISLVRKKAETEIVHTPEEYDFPDSLYQDHWEKAQAWGVVGDSGNLLACIEVCPIYTALILASFFAMSEKGVGIVKTEENR